MATGDSLPEAFKLEGLSNYQTWKMRMKLLLLKENTWQYTDPTSGNIPRPGEGADVAASRVRALYSICMSCREGPFSKISSCVEPRAAWNILASTYQQQTNAGRLMLKVKLNGLRLQEGASVTDYIRQIECLQSELRGLNSEVPESELVERMVNNLPPSFDYVYQNVLGLNALPSFADLTARLLQAETRAKFRSGNEGGSHNEALALRMQNMSLQSGQRSSFSPGGGHHGPSNSYRGSFSGGASHGSGYRSNPGRRLQCNFCGSFDHLMRNCMDLAREMAKRARERRFGGRGRGSSSWANGSQPSYTGSASSNNSGSPYGTSTPYGGPVYQSNIVIDDHYDFSEFIESNLFEIALSGLDLENEDSWIIDSGAAKHVTGNRDMITNLDQQSFGSAHVRTAGGQVLPVEGTGIVNLSTSGEIKMNDVYFVPGLTHSLLSVGRIGTHSFRFLWRTFSAFIRRKTIFCHVHKRFLLIRLDLLPTSKI